MGNVRAWIALAAVSGFIAVAVGAFGAHGISDPRAKELISTGAHYEMIHALASLACAALMQGASPRARHAPAFFLAGSVFFSGSLYGLAAGAPNWVGAITPIGGLLFLIGWTVLVWAALSAPRTQA